MDPEDGREAERRPWERLSSWLECVCVVTFDLELGQAIELLYPPDVKLTEKEVSERQTGLPGVSSSRLSSSPPEKQPVLLILPGLLLRMRRRHSVQLQNAAVRRPPPASGGRPLRQRRPRRPADGSLAFLRLRLLPPSQGRVGQARILSKGTPSDVAARQRSFRRALEREAGASASRLIGSLCPHAGRPAFQSLVVLSRLPFVRLFHAALGAVAPDFFSAAEPCLRTACEQMDRWPFPAPGLSADLPLMGAVLRVRIPSRKDKAGSPPTAAAEEEVRTSKSAEDGPVFDIAGLAICTSAADPQNAPVPPPRPTALPSVHEPDLFRCFRSLLIHTQMLWELALLGEPLAVVAPSPAVSSETVLALVSCIAPLKFCCDFRPYFTVHDGEFREYTAKTRAPPNVILGVTNPFFVKTFHNWPHVLRLGESAEALGDGSPRPQASPRVRSERAPDKSPRLPSGEDVPKQLKIKKMAKLKTLDAKPGVFTAYKSFLLKDKVLIKRVLKGIQRRRPSEVQSAILRRHFLELTQSFIIPLERYMASLMPLQRSVTPWKTPPQIRPFSQDDFLSTLERGGPRLTSALRGDWTGLYRKFFKSPNFDGWYRRRLGEMTRKLESLHLEAVCLADVPGWTRDKSEVEIVDLVVKLREKLSKARRRRLQVREDLLTKLQSLIESIAGTLPKDLQDVLRAQ
ncbi:protein DENND6B isoform X4 [Corythoichthys intestinalis]|uniref:protein DENND6B isoform X4 n=1 Tax=Corythoichthys intestinalis TaxID=161448 RepID=UPI0025A625D3|nr:protein DENND6B isoform X4 [Corythoichthys intestinalis]